MSVSNAGTRSAQPGRNALVLNGLWCSLLACADMEDQHPPSQHEATQGFFDVSIDVTSPEGVSEVCYAIRVQNESGEVVSGADRLCSGEFGNDAGGDILYVMTCDVEAPDHAVTVWVVAPVEGTAWDNPCPPPSGSATSIDTWSGGCAQRVTCVKNRDVSVAFELGSGSR